MFAYMSMGFTKVYRPRNQNMRFFYGGEMPEVYCFGLEQLPNKGDMVFITGGEKFDRKFRHIVFLYNMDDTGRNEAARRMDELSSFHVLRMELPISGAKGDKDISDYKRNKTARAHRLGAAGHHKRNLPKPEENHVH